MNTNYTIDTLTALRRMHIRHDGLLVREELLSLFDSGQIQMNELEEIMSSINNDLYLSTSVVLPLKEINRFLTLKKAVDSKKESSVCRAVSSQLQVLEDFQSVYSTNCDNALEAARSIPHLTATFTEKLPKLVKALNEYAAMCERYFTDTNSYERFLLNIRLFPLAQKAHEIVEKNASLLTIDVYWLMAETLYKEAQSLFEGNIYYFAVIRDFLDAAISEQNLKAPQIALPERFILPDSLLEKTKEVITEETLSEDTTEMPVVEESIEEIIVEEPVERIVTEEPIEEIATNTPEEIIVVEESIEEVTVNKLVEVATVEEPLKEVIANKPVGVAIEEELLLKEVIANKPVEVAIEEEPLLTEVIANKPVEVAIEEEPLKEVIANKPVVKEPIKEVLEEPVKEITVKKPAPQSFNQINNDAPKSKISIPQEPSLPKPTPPRSSSKKHLLIGVSLIVVAGIAGIFLLLNKSTEDINEPQEIKQIEVTTSSTTPEETKQAEPTTASQEVEQKTKQIDSKKTVPNESSEIKQTEPKVGKKTEEQPQPTAGSIEKNKSEETVTTLEKAATTPEKDKNSTSFEAMLKRAKAGNAEAQYRIGQYYESGNGVKVDVFEAITWYRKAKLNGSKEAEKRLIELGY